MTTESETSPGAIPLRDRGECVAVRILALQKSVPWPLSSGLNLRTYHVLQRLAQRHDVLLGCWMGDPQEREHLPFECVLRLLSKESQGVSTRDRFLVRHYGWSPATVPWLNRLVDEFRPDVLFGINYQTLVALDAQALPSACYLGDNRWLEDVERLRQRKSHWRNIKSVLWSTVMHRRYAEAADAYIFVTDRDARALKRFTERLCVGVPNGVDTAHYRPSGALRDKRSVVFVGSLNFPPNVEAVRWLCSEIWPLVRSTMPTARLTLVGKKPVDEVLAWHHRDGIVVAGDVPDVRPYLNRAAVGVVPMRSGGGIKNKILEGWSMAVPLVATTMSLHGLQVEPGENLVVADSAEDFGVEVVRLLGDPSLRQQIGERGRETVERHHSWDHAARQIEDCLLQIQDTLAGVG